MLLFSTVKWQPAGFAGGWSTRIQTDHALWSDGTPRRYIELGVALQNTAVVGILRRELNTNKSVDACKAEIARSWRHSTLIHCLGDESAGFMNMNTLRSVLCRDHCAGGL